MQTEFNKIKNVDTKQKLQVTLTCLINPEFSDDNVVDDSLDFSPGVVIAGVLKLQVSDSQWFDLEILSLELRPHRELLPTPPEAVAAFAELSNHWRVV